MTVHPGRSRVVRSKNSGTSHSTSITHLTHTLYIHTQEVCMVRMSRIVSMEWCNMGEFNNNTNERDERQQLKQCFASGKLGCVLDKNFQFRRYRYFLGKVGCVLQENLKYLFFSPGLMAKTGKFFKCSAKRRILNSGKRPSWRCFSKLFQPDGILTNSFSSLTGVEQIICRTLSLAVSAITLTHVKPYLRKSYSTVCV